MRTKECYKVLRKYDDALRSPNGLLNIKYAQHEWIYPFIGKIFIFTDFFSARQYIRILTHEYTEKNLEIWSCLAENVVPARFALPVDSLKNQVTVQKFWSESGFTDNYADIERVYTPIGTNVCDCLKLDKLLCKRG